MTPDDAAFIAGLRARAARFINLGAVTAAAQREWIAHYLDRAGDYYFIVERPGSGGAAQPEGTVALYQVDATTRTAEWGRFVLEPGSPAAIEATLLTYRCAFDTLALDGLVCRTLAENAQVVAFHDSCGLVRTPLPVTILHNGEPRPSIEHRLLRSGWPDVERRLEGLALRLAKRTPGAARAMSP